MNRTISIALFFLLLLTATSTFAGKSGKLRVLFIGNSLTSVNNLPRMIADLAENRQGGMEYEMHAPGGYRLSQHASDPELLEKIKEGTWDFVVLQEQSQLPAFPQTQLKKDVFPYAKKICALIKKANPQARIIFYETMAKKNGDSQNAAIYPELKTYEGMQKKINIGYALMSQQNKGLVVPVGVAWKIVRTKNPAIELYADETHPSLTGSYLAACTFYAVLFGDSPVGLPHPSQIDNATADFLQKTAEETVQTGTGSSL